MTITKEQIEAWIRRNDAIEWGDDGIIPNKDFEREVLRLALEAFESREVIARLAAPCAECFEGERWSQGLDGETCPTCVGTGLAHVAETLASSVSASTHGSKPS